MSTAEAESTCASPSAAAVLPNSLGRRLTIFLTLLPIALATGYTIYLSTNSMLYRLRVPYTLTPWEAAIVADAYRAAHGQPVYEKQGVGHATHLYGPLISQTIGLVFRITGKPNLWAGRLINMLGALAACAILVAIYVNWRNPWDLFLAAGLMLSLHYRSRAYFTETRPDMIAMLFAVLTLLCLYRGHLPALALARRSAWYLVALVLLVITFLFKQTFTACAAIPLVAVILTRPQPFKQHVILALVPLAAIVVMLAGMKFFAPLVYFYTVSVPQMSPVDPGRIATGAMLLFTCTPIFPAVLLAYLSGDRLRRESPKMLWLVAANFVGLAAAMIAFGKQLASYNSLLLGWVPMAVLCAAIFPGMLRGLIVRLTTGDATSIGSLAPDALLVATGWVFGALLMIMTYSVPKTELWNWNGGHGSPKYKEVIRAAARLKGTVVCPQDPTIPMFARGYVGTAVECEVDASGRHERFPPMVLAELDRAQWLVFVNSDCVQPRKDTPEFLASLGFKQAKKFDACYTLWRRNAPSGVTTNPTTRPKQNRGPASQPAPIATQPAQ